MSWMFDSSSICVKATKLVWYEQKSRFDNYLRIGAHKYEIQNFKRAEGAEEPPGQWALNTNTNTNTKYKISKELRVQRGLALWQGSEPGWHKKGKGWTLHRRSSWQWTLYSTLRRPSLQYLYTGCSTTSLLAPWPCLAFARQSSP